MMPSGMSLPQASRGHSNYVLDGGAFHRIAWNLGTTCTYDKIMSAIQHIMKRHYGEPIVVFDGYLNGPSTKDTTQ